MKIPHLNRSITPILDRRWWRFQWQYWRGHTPWDTNITPPEVMAFLSTATPGRVLDLGCGTGTNAVTMAQIGWQVVGIDYVPQAIRKARRKAKRAGVAIDFRVGDVLSLPGFDLPFDYVLDIGCLHSLDPLHHRHYARLVAHNLAPGGTYMLYAWLPRMRNGKRLGLTIAQTHDLFAPPLKEKQTVVGEEKGSPSAWYWFKK
jgi:SAM-dependent methyltransferase